MSRSSTPSSETAAHEQLSTPRTLSLVETPCVLCGSHESEPAASGYDFEYDTVPDLFHFVRCRECDHLYLKPRPSAADLPIIYPSNYYAFSEEPNTIVAPLRRYWESGKVRLYADLMGQGRKRILDVGCGDGRFLTLMRKYGPPDWELVGIDIDEDSVRRCRELGFEAHLSRVEDFDMGEGDFDAVIMLQLIEHVEDPASLSERVFSLLRPGGCFVVETPNAEGLDYRIFKRSWWGHYHIPRHWNLFSTRALHRMLEEKGFSILRSEYLINTSAWIISLHNYFLDKGYPGWFVRFFHYQNPLLLSIFVLVDFISARLGRETSNQRVVAQRPE